MQLQDRMCEGLSINGNGDGWVIWKIVSEDKNDGVTDMIKFE